MVLGYIVLFTVIMVFIIASIEDIKKREVYDYINFSFLFCILTAGILDSVYNMNIFPISSVFFGMCIGFILGSILYYLGIWGGGDAKFLIGFAGASYYMLNFTNYNNKNYYIILHNILEKFTYFVSSNVDTATYILNIINFSSIFVMIVLTVFYVKKKQDMKNTGLLFMIFFLFITSFMYMNFRMFFVINGLLAFSIIFFSKEDIFSSVYYIIKIKTSNIKQEDIIEGVIKSGDKIIVNQKDAPSIITKEDVDNIKMHSNSLDEVFVKKRCILPYSILIIINFISYSFILLTQDILKIHILSFVLLFMFFSFIAGGIIGILMLIFHYIINIKHIRITFCLKEKLIMLIFSSIVVFVSFLNSKFAILITLIFIKIAKIIEKHMFVSKKDIYKISLGDWVVEDIKINNKIIYHKEDFKLGIDEDQLKRIKELAQEHEHLKKILVKDGLAFIPALFIGFAIVMLM